MNPLKLITKPIGCLCSLLGGLILLFVLAGVIGLWSFNHLAPGSIEKVIEKKGGFPVTIDEAGYRVLDSAFHIEDLIVENPPNFPERDFLHMRTITLEADPRELFDKTEKNISRLTINIQRLNWVLTDAGSSNIALFAREVRTLADSSDPISSSETAHSARVAVNTWDVKIGMVEVSDYTQTPVQREKLLINYERTFTGAPNAQEVINGIVNDLHGQRIAPPLRLLLTSLLQMTDLSGLIDPTLIPTEWIENL